MRIQRFALLATASAVTISIDSTLPALKLKTSLAVASPLDLLEASCPEEFQQTNTTRPELLLSSHSQAFGEKAQNKTAFTASTIYPSSGSIVRGAIEAWAQHQHLVLRPDEVWFEVLVQMNYYMSKNAEQIRHLFVDFEGKQDITILANSWQKVIEGFSQEIASRVKTKWLLDWVMPEFSTSDTNDKMTATVLMMGLVKRYFSFTGGITCGIPSVTLLGDKADWQRLLDKLDRLPEFGQEPADYAVMLRPIFTMFIKSFDDAGSDDVKSFWKQIVRADHGFACGRGPIEYSVSGWIQGFMHWREDGFLRTPREVALKKQNETLTEYDQNVVTIEGVRYFPDGMEHLVVGYAKAPFTMLDYPADGQKTSAYLLAGNIGINRTRVPTLRNANSVTGQDDFAMAQPMSSWFLFAPVDTKKNDDRYYGSIDELRDVIGVMKSQPECPGNNDMRVDNTE
ncbi:hypothetical protein VHEMI02288 [[Torrubiella] hemipterigena]|uniref:DUF4419 domain-containing protein n=1 Tax=[Torrubiella] hemipterigena TaxID=1531966 RepID=A0A0A1T7T7_9HYPO|nr:hypothetical protein VHEMI02288 [[Torrubiella] hemipterigena]